MYGIGNFRSVTSSVTSCHIFEAAGSDLGWPPQVLKPSKIDSSHSETSKNIYFDFHPHHL